MSKQILTPIATRLLAIALLAAVLASGWGTAGASGGPKPPAPLPQPVPLAGEPQAPPPAGTGDKFFGYTLAYPIYNWIDATGGTLLFSDTDNDVSAAIPLGFNFKFYENTYSSVYIGANGLIGFNSSLSTSHPAAFNYPIPLDYEFPQNIIAPFWDNLIIGGGANTGKVYYATGIDVSGMYFIVQWHQVTVKDAAGTMTFQVVLHQNGNILFQYQSMNGPVNSASIGIEDADGIDGLQYIYNDGSWWEGVQKAVSFTRPNAGYRVKQWPLENSAFAYSSGSAKVATYKLKIRNTGDGPITNDTYNFSWTPTSPWTLTLWNAAGTTQLTDSDGDGKKDTGAISAGATVTVTAKLTSLTTAVVGDTFQTALTATSKRAVPTKLATATLFAAVPAPFAQTSQDGSRVLMELYSEAARVDTQQYDAYNGGDTIAVHGIGDGRYMTMWQTTQGSLNLEQAYISSGGQILSQDQFTQDINDDKVKANTQAVMATAPNGNSAVAWVRSQTRLGDFRELYAIQLAILNTSGGPVTDTIVVSETVWSSPQDAVYLQMDSVRVTATSNNLFHLTWVQRETSGGSEKDTLGYAVYDASTGARSKRYTIWSPTAKYTYPAIAPFYSSSLGTQLVLLFFFSRTGVVDTLVYKGILNDGSLPLGSPVNIYTGTGANPDATQLTDGRVAVAWSDYSTVPNHINLVIMGSDLSLPASPYELTNPDERSGGGPSISAGPQGSVVVTWMDYSFFERLYYAFVKPTGITVAPMIFKLSQYAGTEFLRTSPGNGNAPMEFHEIMLPIIRKP